MNISAPYALHKPFFYLGLTCLFLSACAPRHKQFPLAMNTSFSESALNLEDGAWRACRFKIAWPEHLGADGAVDLLLAHSVVQPVLQNQVHHVPWWRFHRRAARDDSGHQFSFLFYTTPGISKKLMSRIQESPVLQELLASKIIERATCDDPKTLRSSRIEAMSDTHWSPALQKHWPAYIMGVSTLWLGLIDDAMTGSPELKDIFIRLEQYRKASAIVTEIWRKEGQHAFFHHLSAVFGYEPLMIQKEIQF